MFRPERLERGRRLSSPFVAAPETNVGPGENLPDRQTGRLQVIPDAAVFGQGSSDAGVR